MVKDVPAHAALRAKRKALALKAEDLARLAGVSRATVWRVESGKQQDSLPDLMAALQRVEAGETDTNRNHPVTTPGATLNGSKSDQQQSGSGGTAIRPTIFARYAYLRDQLSADQLAEASAVERRVFEHFKDIIPDPEERQAESVRITVGYIERMLQDAERVAGSGD